MHIKGINHITFICQDLEKSSHFLIEVFDAKEVYSSGNETFSIAREKFFLIGSLWVAIMEGEPLPRTYNHVAFSVAEESLPLLESKIKALGLTILPGRPHVPEEGQSLYFYDHDNHLFELNTGDLATRLQYYTKHSNQNR